MGEQVSKSVEPYFFTGPRKDVMIFKYVLQVMLAFIEKVAAERKANVK